MKVGAKSEKHGFVFGLFLHLQLNRPDVNLFL